MAVKKGRRPIPPDQRLSRQMLIRLTVADYRQLEKRATEINIDPAVLVRMMILKDMRRYNNGRKRAESAATGNANVRK